MKKIISICLSLIMILSLGVTAFADTRIAVTDETGNTTYLSDFKDTSGHWAHDVILKWAEYELIQGNQGNFMPNNPIKRGDLCLILDRMLGLKSISYNFFYDLPSDKYYTEAVLKCVAAGLINGTSSTTVDPEGYATREQIAAIMCRLLALDSSGWRNVRKFNDDANVGSWAKDSVYTMRKYGYMNGDNSNNVNPKSNITRAEFVQVMNNIAGSYIPKNDRTGIGSSFKSDFVTNLMTSRNIELVNSTVGRDLVLTQATSSTTLTNTTIVGRLYVMGRNSIYLSNTSIGQIFLKEGKSDIAGITDKIKEVYVAQYASESSLDSIPTRLVLEPGVRVRIDGVFYENTSAYNKTYYGIDIKADIAAEQGYVVGGPRITNVKMTQGIDNVISVSDARVTANGSIITEIGVVWLNQDSDEDIVIPSYQNRSGIYKYWSTKIDDNISFDIGSVSGIRTYRMYVKDSDGLFAYSQPFTFSAYSYSMNLKVYDNDYPKKIDVELIVQGNNLPSITGVKVTYGTDETYSENRAEISLSLYNNADAEYQVDSSKYRRYIATINVDSVYDTTTQQYVYIPPTHYGYIITFRNNEKINRYPVLSNVVPEGVSPMGELKTGSASYLSDGRIQIKNNMLTTRYVIPQEVGILYKVSNNNNAGTPIADANGWIKSNAYVNVGLGETIYYNNTINPNTSEGYTHYCAYVRTSNGYWYGNVYSIPNSSNGDKDGFKIISIDTAMIGDDAAYLAIYYDNTNKSVSSGCILDLGILGKHKLSTLTYFIDNFMLYVKIDNLNPNTMYSIPVRLYDLYDNKSNAVMISIDTREKMDLRVTNKQISGDNISYILASINNLYGNFNWKTATLLNTDKSVVVSSDGILSVDKSINVANEKVVLTFEFLGFIWERTINLY